MPNSAAVRYCVAGCDDDDCCCCDDEFDYMEAMCPHCGESISFDSEIEPEDLICPACGKKFADAE